MCSLFERIYCKVISLLGCGQEAGLSRISFFVKRLRLYPFFLLFVCPLWGVVNQNNDVQIWVTEGAVFGTGERYQLHLANEWRFGNDVSQWFHTYLEGIFKIQCTDRIDIGPGYRQTWRLQQDKWRLAFEPMFNLFFHHKEVFQLRNRLSYIINQKDQNIWQYRFRVRLKADYWTYNPYFSNEIFVISHDGFSENRTQVGVDVPLWNRTRSDVYYMLRFKDDNNVWTHQHIFGVWLHMRF